MVLEHTAVDQVRTLVACNGASERRYKVVVQAVHLEGFH